MSAIAKRKSAAVIVDEKSVGKIPYCAGPLKDQKVHGPTGSSKGSGERPISVTDLCIHVRSRLSPTPGLQRARDTLPTSPAYSPSTRSVRSVGWEGSSAMGSPIPFGSCLHSIAGPIPINPEGEQNRSRDTHEDLPDAVPRLQGG